METACKKNEETQNKNSIYMKCSYPFTMKNFFISLFSASYDILKTRLETMQSHEDSSTTENYFSTLL